MAVEQDDPFTPDETLAGPDNPDPDDTLPANMQSLFIALDGVTESDISKRQADKLEQHLVEYALTELQLSISDVRVASLESTVIEYHDD